MDGNRCHLCGRIFTGEFCPNCGAAVEHDEVQQAASKPARKKKLPPAAAPTSGLLSHIGKVRSILWGMLIITLILSVLFIRRTSDFDDNFLWNFDYFLECRSEITYLWEVPDAFSQFSPLTFAENIPRSLRLIGDNFYNTMEEVSNIWLAH